jgi:hypothetical protein
VTAACEFGTLDLARPPAQSGQKHMQIDAIVFIHRGAHDHVRDVLEVAARSNRHTRIVLLGDEANRSFSKDVEHHHISDYDQDVRSFEKSYLHLSTNSYDFEFFCLSRWMILNCFCQRYGMRGIFHADSDVLVYSSITDIANALLDCELAVSLERSPHASFWTAETLSDFAGFIASTYRTKDGPDFQELAALHNRFSSERRPGGVCDMALINLFVRDRKCFDLTETIFGGTFDNNINMSDNGNTKFEMFRGIKKLTWRRSIPYGRRFAGTDDVRFHVLHCQGAAKQWISELCAERPPRIIRSAARRVLRVGGKLLAPIVRGNPSG